MKRSFLRHDSLRVEAAPDFGPVPGRQARGKRRGIILVLTLWLSIVLTLLALSLAYEMQMEMKLTSARRKSSVAYELARLGVARGVADLKNDFLLDHEPDEKNPQARRYDGPGDIWRLTADKTDVEVKDVGSYSVSIVDLESKLSINSLTPRHVDMLKFALTIVGLRDKEAEELAQAIHDWIDPDTLPTAGQGESEIDFYNEKYARSLKLRWDEETIFVKPKNDVILTLEELLEVPGMTRELLYGYDATDPEQVTERRERIEDGKDVPPGLVDIFTVRSTGALNLNTAGFYPLATVFAAARQNLGEGEKLAREIMKHVGNNDRGKIDNDRALKSPQDIAVALKNDMSLLALAQQVHPLTIESAGFLIRSTGEIVDSDGEVVARRTIETQVTRQWWSFQHDDEFGKNRDSTKHTKRRQGRRLRPRDSDKIGLEEEPIVQAVFWNE